MNRKEHFLAALKLQEPDRVPMFDFLFQQPLYEKLIGHRPESYNGRDAVEWALALDHDGVWLPFGGFTGLQPKCLAENVYQDEWGTIYQKSEASSPIDAPIDYPIKNRGDLKNYCVPDPTLSGRDSEIRVAVEMENDDLAILSGVGGRLTTAWMLMGYENICLDTVKKYIGRQKDTIGIRHFRRNIWSCWTSIKLSTMREMFGIDAWRVPWKGNLKRAGQRPGNKVIPKWSPSSERAK